MSNLLTLLNQNSFSSPNELLTRSLQPQLSMFNTQLHQSQHIPQYPQYTQDNLKRMSPYPITSPVMKKQKTPTFQDNMAYYQNDQYALSQLQTTALQASYNPYEASTQPQDQYFNQNSYQNQTYYNVQNYPQTQSYEQVLLNQAQKAQYQDINMTIQLQLRQLQELQQIQQLQMAQSLSQNSIQQPLYLNVSQFSQLPNVDSLSLNNLQSQFVINQKNAQYLALQQQMAQNETQQIYYQNYLDNSSNYHETTTNELSKPKIPQLYLQQNQEIHYEHSEMSTKTSDGYKSEEEEIYEEIKNVEEKQAKIIRRKKSLIIENKTPENSSPLDSTKSAGDRRKNKWQIVQEQIEREKIELRVKLINESTVNFAEQKVKEIPIGENHQVEMSIINVQATQTRRRAVKSVWNPENAHTEAVSKFLGQVQNELSVDINEEKTLKILADCKNDVEVAFATIRAERRKYTNLLSLKIQKKFII